MRAPRRFRGGGCGSDSYPLFGDQQGGGGLSFKTSPPSPSFFMNLNNGHPLLGGHLSDSEGNHAETSSTPPTVFSPAGFPIPIPPPLTPGSGNGSTNSNQSAGGGQQQGQQAWPGLPLGPAPIFGRHRAQHSAPRGGPPRAWSNSDLTEALHNVWNKKMTTSQVNPEFP